jgi:2-C-methyl-D-erythritol 2,4-cyclodiphosphate synthase
MNERERLFLKGLEVFGVPCAPSDDRYRGIDSCLLLAETRDIVRSLGFRIEYADMTVVAQKPKLAAYLPAMRERIAEVLEIPADRVNVKATTEEKMGFTGREEGIACEAVASIYR